MPVPTAVPPCASACSRGRHRLQSRHAVLDLRAPGAHLLAERHRHRVHQVRATGLDRSRRRRPPCARSSRSSSLSAGSSCLRQRERGAQVDRRRDHVVAALAAIDVIVRMDRRVAVRHTASRGARSPRSHSCCCWCPSPSGTRRSGTAHRGGPRRPRAPRAGSRTHAPCRARRSSRLAPAAAHLISPSARMNPRGIGRPLIGKFWTARCVWAPQSAVAGTRTSPMLSRSTRNSLSAIEMRSGKPRRRRATGACGIIADRSISRIAA